MNRPRLSVPDRLEIVGHGGAGDFYPGNSLQSIEKALEIGIDRLEVDIQCSSDGEIVLAHDEKLHVDSRYRWVSHISTSTLRATLPGFLTLSEAIDVVSGRVPFMLDIKSRGLKVPLVHAIRAHGLDKDSSVSCEQPTTIRNLRTEFPKMRLGISTGHVSSGTPTVWGKRVASVMSRTALLYPLLAEIEFTGANEVMIFHHACSRSLIDGLHSSGVLVTAWTVDRPKSMKRILELQPDGIITNRPDLLHEEILNFETVSSDRS